jgi:polyphosphate kinase
MSELVVTHAEQPQRKPRSALLEPLEAPRPPTPSDLPGDRFINRETSWLDFNARVLALAEDVTIPLLERAKFLAIFASNLDEFYMVRVAGLMRREATGLAVRSADGLTSREQLDLISERVTELAERHARCFTDEVLPSLTHAGIGIGFWHQLSESQQERLHDYFHKQIFPVLTPLAVDPAHPFPYISGLSLNLAVKVREPGGEEEHFARVKVPQNVPRLVRVDRFDRPRSAAAGHRARPEGQVAKLPSGGGQPADGADVVRPVRSDDVACYVPLEEVIAAHLSQLFPGMEVVDSHLFRVTRNADLEVEEDEAEDLLQALERELVRRRFGPAVRLEVDDSIDDGLLSMLMRELEVTYREVHRVDGLLDLSVLWALYDLDRPELKDPPRVPATHPRLITEDGEAPSFFGVLREGDVLVHHPYDSFTTSVQRFIEQAAADPKVLAIKQTLYRTSGDSPIVDALISAAEADKQVVVLVEIKARFDESANIRWARELERAGCHVVYGLIGLKTHCKTCLVVRQEGAGLRRYCHVGTGNYNPGTARLYEDLGLLTADPDVGADLTDLFNVLTGYSRQTEYRTLLVAPQHMRDGIIERIEWEAAAARAGRSAGIRLKVNSLVDEQIIDALYRASIDGVPVSCLVRGICALRPGVPGLSETVHVRSILGRFLEHSRVLEFTASGEYWIGSADMMHRNLDRRIETLVRVSQPESRASLRTMLDHAFSPGVSAWELRADGRWERRATAADGARLSDYQADLLARTQRRERA